jgi:colanic acid biosynthesis glycosyl transferase WcaI
MDLLLITPFFPPEVGSASHMIYELGQALRGRGHGVLVLTGLPRYHVTGSAAKLPPSQLFRENY